MNKTIIEQGKINRDDEFHKLFDSDYSMQHLPFPNDYYKDQNLQLLYSTNNRNKSGFMYCEIDSQVIAKSIREFFLLADYWCYISRTAGLSKACKYYLHKNTGQVFELCAIDEPDSCLAEQIAMSVNQVFDVAKGYQYHTLYKSKYRSYQIDYVLSQ